MVDSANSVALTSQMVSPMSESPPDSLAEFEPERRNWIWLGIQTILRLFFSVWFRYRAYGYEELKHQRGMLFVINHQSFLDPLLVGLPLSRPICYLARDSLFRIPVVGWILRHTSVLPINREAASTAALRTMIGHLRAGYWVGIFPEGTRSTDGTLGEMKPGFLALLRRTQVPVCPVGIAGAQDALGRGAWFPHFAKVRVFFGPTIPACEIRTLLEEGERSLEKIIRDSLVSSIQEAVMRR